uniref:Kit ligand n=1 Tax=Oreochromis niloticus TaxID=8128 RepID=I3K126_ORENI
PVTDLVALMVSCYRLYVTFVVCCRAFLGPELTSGEVNTYRNLCKQDLPNNYLIPISYVPKEAGTCWVVLNIYPMEKSLEKLTNNFGDKSTNRESLLIFIEILQTVCIFIFNSEILMQYFDCHYQEQHIPSGPYFDYMENLLRGADQGLFDFSCEPPPCPSTQQTFTTPQETSQSPHNLSTQQTPGTMLMQLMHLFCFFVVVLFFVICRVSGGRQLDAFDFCYHLHRSLCHCLSVFVAGE